MTGQLLDSVDKKKVTITFENSKSIVTGRQKSSDVIRNKPGLSRHSKNAKTPIKCFSLFFTDEVLDLIISNTNKRIKETLQKLDQHPYLKPTNVEEMKAFIALL